MRGLLQLIARDISLALRQGADAVIAVLFFVLVAVLFPLGIGPEPQVLSRIAPGVIWVAALLASLLSLDRLFQADFEDGSLDQLALLDVSLETVVVAKATAHWLTTGVPLILASPLLAVFLQMDVTGLGILLLSLALGTPILSIVGAVGAALTLGARRGGVLIALLVLPLVVPALIFGAAAVDAALLGLTPRPHLLLLGALFVGTATLGPIAAAAALRQALA